MPTIQKQIHLNVTAPVAYRYLLDPAHSPAFCSNISDVSEIRKQSPTTTHFLWRYNMIGVRFEGEAVMKEEKYGEQIHIRVSGGIHASVTWMITPADSGINLSVLVEYAVPKPLLQKHSEETVIRANAHTTTCMLENLKMLLEVETA